MKRYRHKLIATTLAISQVLMPITYIVSSLSDLRAETIVKEVELDNQPPLADLTAISKKKVDIVFAVGQTTEENLIGLNEKIEANITSFLNANGGDVLDAHINTVETSSMDFNDSGADEIMNSWVNFPDASGQWNVTDIVIGGIHNKVIGTTQNKYCAI